MGPNPRRSWHAVRPGQRAAVTGAGAAGNSEVTYTPLAQIAPQQYGQIYGAFGRPNSNYDATPAAITTRPGDTTAMLVTGRSVRIMATSTTPITVAWATPTTPSRWPRISATVATVDWAVGDSVAMGDMVASAGTGAVESIMVLVSAWGAVGLGATALGPAT